MTTKTDAPNDDSTFAADDDSASPDSLILDYSCKHKINPKSMLLPQKWK